MDKKMLEVWKEALGKMTLTELLQIECKISQTADTQWKNMFLAVAKVKEALKCPLCDIAIITKIPCIRQHVLGKKHLRKMELKVTAIRHPTINPFKASAADDSKPANANKKGQNISSKTPLQGNKQSDAPKPTNQNVQPGVAAKPLNQIAQSQSDAASKASIQNTQTKSDIPPKSANQNTQSQSSVVSKPTTQNTQLKPGIAQKPLNQNTQSKPGIVQKMPIQNNQPKPSISPKPANQNTQQKTVAQKPGNETTQVKPGIALKSANQNTQLKPGISPKPANQNTQSKSGITPKSANLNTLTKPGISPKLVNQSIQPKPGITPKPSNQNTQPKAGIPPKPANQSIQPKPGISPKPANQNIQPKPGISPKPANQNTLPKSGIAPKSTNQNTQLKPSISPKLANQNTQTKPGIPVKPVNQNKITQPGSAPKPPLQKNQTKLNVPKAVSQSTVIPPKDVKQENALNPPEYIMQLNKTQDQELTSNKGEEKINVSNKNNTVNEPGTSKSANENINTLNGNSLATGNVANVEKCVNKKEAAHQNPENQSKQVAANNQDKNIPKNVNAGKPSTLVINPASLLSQKELTNSGKHLKELMKTFEMKDLMVIQFRYAGFQWRPMFKKLPDGAYKCLLCGTYILKNFEDLRQHNESIRHATSINAVEKLFHPKLAPTKDLEAASGQENKMEEPAFRMHLPDMPLEEIKSVEYLVDEKWTLLINEAANVIRCNLCNANNILTYTGLIDHLMSKAHLGNLSHVDKLFHPTLTYDKITLENKIKKISTSQPVTNPAETSNVICIEDSPEREIRSTTSNKDEELTKLIGMLDEEPKEIASSTVVSDVEPKKFVNPVAILAQSNKKIAVIQNQDRILPKPQYRPPPPMQAFNMMRPPFSGVPIQPPIQPNFNLNQGTEMVVPSAVVVPSPRHINPPPRSQDPKFSNKNLASTKMEEIEGFIGIEYVVKIVRNANDNMPRYECCLCEIETDGLGMQLHLKGLAHRRKFLERHFPTAMRQFLKYKDNVKYVTVMTQACDKLAIAIQKYHGRDLPYECLDDEFSANRDRVMSKVFSFRHASEHSGPSFTNIVDKKMLDEFISNSNHKMPEPNTDRLITFDPRHTSAHKRKRVESPPPLDVEQHKRLVEKFLENTTLPNTKRRSTYHRSPPRSHHHRRSSPRRSSSKKSTFGSADDWDSYKRMFDDAVEDLDKYYDEYKKDPEKHPLYDEEWKKYWVRKSKSLRNVGIDPSTYNFQPGWVRFFSRRVHQMYDIAVDDIRKTLRERLGLPYHNDNLSDIKYHIGVHCVVDQNDEDDLLEKEDLELARQQNELGDFSMELPSELLDEDKSDDITKMDTVEDTHQSDSDQETEMYNMVPVLRLLTALEDQLGSLGPKVNDLLSKALTLEKVKPNSSDENLITEENCVFLETVNEKLKGQVIAGMIVGNKLKAVKQAIRDLSGLLEMANEILSNKPKVLEPPKEVKTSIVQKRPIKPTGSSEQPSKKQCLDKEEIATKLAAALAAQGKTDFSSEQLEQLVAVYTLIEKKQRETGATRKPEFLNEQQKKSLSETLIDFLKPNAEEEPTKQQDTLQQSHSFYSDKQNPQSTATSNFSKSIAGSNRSDNYPMGNSSNMQSRLQQPSHRSHLLSDNFSQLRQFDTSLNISNLNRNTSITQNWGSSSSTMQKLSNMNTAQGSFRQGPSFMNPNMNQSISDRAMTSNSQSNPFGFYPNQNRGTFNMSTNEMSAPRSQGPTQPQMNEFNQRQLSSNIPVMTSNSMMRGAGGGIKNPGNPPMISYPQSNVRQNQRGNTFPSNFMEDDRMQPPIGWQRNNAGRR